MTDVPTPAAQTPAVATPRDTTSARQGWSKHDTTWMLGLYGTAIGAGTLFPVSYTHLTLPTNREV